MSLDVEVEKENHSLGEVIILKLIGDMKQEYLPPLENIIQEIFDAQEARLILDLENVYSITSSGLGLLINFIQHPNASLGIRLIHVQSKFKVLFDLLGMGDRLKIFPDKEAALVDWQ